MLLIQRSHDFQSALTESPSGCDPPHSTLPPVEIVIVTKWINARRAAASLLCSRKLVVLCGEATTFCCWITHDCSSHTSTENVSLSNNHHCETEISPGEAGKPAERAMAMWLNCSLPWDSHFWPKLRHSFLCSVTGLLLEVQQVRRAARRPMGWQQPGVDGTKRRANRKGAHVWAIYKCMMYHYFIHSILPLPWYRGKLVNANFDGQTNNSVLQNHFQLHISVI